MKKIYLFLSIIASLGLLHSAGKASDSINADPINQTNSLHVFSNNEVLDEIVKYLNDTDIASLRATSKAVNNCFKLDLNLKILDRRYRKTGKEIKLSLYRRGDAIVWEGKTLQIVKKNIRDFLGLKQDKIPEFVKFVVHKDATDSELKELAGIKNVDISQCYVITDAGLAHLKSATTVNLSRCSKITDAGLARLKNATTVIISGCSKITDAGLARLKNATTVNLSWCEKITDAGLAHLKNATTVYLSWCSRKLRGAGLVHLKNATTVDLSFCYKLENGGLASLKNATTVNISGCRQITDIGLAYLPKATTVYIALCEKITYEAINKLYQRGVTVEKKF